MRGKGSLGLSLPSASHLEDLSSLVRRPFQPVLRSRIPTNPAAAQRAKEQLLLADLARSRYVGSGVFLRSEGYLCSSPTPTSPPSVPRGPSLPSKAGQTYQRGTLHLPSHHHLNLGRATAVTSQRFAPFLVPVELQLYELKLWHLSILFRLKSLGLEKSLDS